MQKSYQFQVVSCICNKMKTVILFTFLLTLQVCLCKPKAKSGDEKSELVELAENAQKVAQKVSQDLGIADIDSAKITKTVSDGTETFLKNLDSFLKTVKTETEKHDGDVKTFLKTTETKLNGIYDDLKKAVGPDTSKKAEELQVEFKKAFKTSTDQIQQLVKTYEPQAKDAGENLAKMSKTFLDSLLDLGKNIQTQVNKAVEEHQATHKN